VSVGEAMLHINAQGSNSALCMEEVLCKVMYQSPGFRLQTGSFRLV